LNRNHTPSGLLEQDPSIYQKLIDTYSKLLWTIAAGILSGSGSQEDVEEVVADVFIDLWKHPEAYEPQRGGIRTYLCLRARSLALDRLRKLIGRQTVSIEELDVSPFPLEDRDTVLAVQEYLAQLPPPDGEILTLRLIYECKPALIAKKLRLPVTQVYEKIRRGKERLIAALWEQEVSSCKDSGKN